MNPGSQKKKRIGNNDGLSAFIREFEQMQKLSEGGWPSGPIPYGYRNINKKLVIEPGEAEKQITAKQFYKILANFNKLYYQLTDLEKRKF